MTDLLPCPFCGETNVGFGRTGQKWQTVACNECGAEGPCTEIDRELIIQKWNARIAETILADFVRAYELQDADNFTDEMRDVYATASVLTSRLAATGVGLGGVPQREQNPSGPGGVVSSPSERDNG